MKGKEKKHTLRTILLIIFLGGLPFLALATMGIISYAVYQKNAPRSNIPAEISVIKDANAQIDVAKQEGDEDQKYSQAQTDATYGQWSISATFDQSIGNYATAVFNWGQSIQDNASKKNWSKITEEPGTFSLNLSSRDASDAYDDTLSHIDYLKSFGDYAIAKKDKTTMRWLSNEGEH